MSLKSYGHYSNWIWHTSIRWMFKIISPHPQFTNIGKPHQLPSDDSDLFVNFDNLTSFEYCCLKAKMALSTYTSRKQD
ncbi:unnamed protein product [Rhizophagus irregularis]|nr:unnamed protein product [Rhizophagus irregularis]CAB5385959.1 unnamed protein product [Rhizophagus irregularis]